MSRVSEQLLVPCPAAEADARLARYFSRLRRADGTVRLRLQVSLGGARRLPDVALERNVIATISRGRDIENINDVTRISWAPEGGGPFPRFDGTLLTWGEDDPRFESFVGIEGEYTPPLGAAGKLFDGIAGKRIAHRTCLALLQQIAVAISD